MPIKTDTHRMKGLRSEELQDRDENLNINAARTNRISQPNEGHYRKEI